METIQLLVPTNKSPQTTLHQVLILTTGWQMTMLEVQAQLQSTVKSQAEAM